MGDSDASRTTVYGEIPSAKPEKGIKIHIARWLSGVVHEFIQLTLPAATAVFIFAPPVLAVIAGGIAGVNCLLLLFQVGKAFKSGQYSTIFADLPALSSAAKIAFGSLAFLALLYALSVLVTGLIGTRLQHLYLILGFILSIPALFAYTVAAFLLVRMLGSITGWGEVPFVIFFGYIGLDAAVLGLLATDLRLARRRTRVPSVQESGPDGVPGDGQETGITLPTVTEPTLTVPTVRIRRKVGGRAIGRIRFSRVIRGSRSERAVSQK